MTHRSLALTRHALRQARRDMSTWIQMLLTPVVFIAFLKPAFGPLLQAEGHAGATGAEQAVPGMLVMFSLFGAGMVGFSIFQEHGWSTWDRLRASQARPVEIMTGKMLPAFLLSLVQQGTLLGLGVIAFGLSLRGGHAAVLVLGLALAACVVTFGALLAAVLRTSQQLNAALGMGTMLMAGLGGAFLPLSALPGWAQAVAPAVPTYWAMRGYRAVILDRAGLAGAVAPTLALLAFAAAFMILAARRFRFDEAKHMTG